MVKHTGYPQKIIDDTYDFMVKECIWDANSGLGAERVNFTADLMTQGRQHRGTARRRNTRTWSTSSFAKEAIAKLGEWKGPVCPTPAMLIGRSRH